MRAKLQEIKKEMQRRKHQPIPDQAKWLRQVATGFFAYHAVPTNSRALHRMTWSRIKKLADDFLPQARHRVTDLWRRSLRRRSQKDRVSFIPGLTHALPSNIQGGSRVPLNWARSDLCGGRSVMRVPTAIFRFG